MVYSIRIVCNNAAFDDDLAGLEIARILRDLAEDCEENVLPVTASLRDSNGNKVGDAVLMGRGQP